MVISLGLEPSLGKTVVASAQAAIECYVDCLGEEMHRAVAHGEMASARMMAAEGRTGHVAREHLGRVPDIPVGRVDTWLTGRSVHLHDDISVAAVNGKNDPRRRHDVFGVERYRGGLLDHSDCLAGELGRKLQNVALD